MNGFLDRHQRYKFLFNNSYNGEGCVLELKEKSVIIVGGSSGLGLATAKAAVSKGANVVITGRSQERLDNARICLGGQVETAVADALCISDMDNLFSGPKVLDHLFVTVGSYVADHHLEPSITDLKRPVDDRLLAALHATKYAFPYMNPTGSITLMSGTAVSRPITGTSMSSASCGAIEGLARGLAIDFAPIRVNA